jgi:hypothetical protein
VSLRPEKEQSELPLLIEVPGAGLPFTVGGGPVISPAEARDDTAKAAAPRATRQRLERWIMTDPLF